ncbi:MAG: sigma-70 family RNA polymerase sigma factor [Candidatus Aminicenantes bacterium]|nr:MAG: sigma-70 family RNA polymerase sigma factor [Candidatus Aminicenantes bacterium]
MNREEERELIQAVKAGNYRQFDRLIVAYQKPLYIFIWRMVQDEDDAKDICQDTFFKAYKKIKSFKEKSKFSSWLFQIGYRKALDFLAKKKRQRTMLNKMEAKSQTAGNERQFEIKQEDSVIGKIIDGLQRNHRTALHLFYKEEMTYYEIASVMKVPINTVKSHIHRGKEIIRDRLSRKHQWDKQPT